MAVEMIVPALGEVVEEVTILNWFKAEGDRVAKAEPLLEVESEKVTTEIPSPAEGILGRIFYSKGAKVRVTTVIAVIVSEGEPVPDRYGQPSAGAAAPSPGQPAVPPPEGKAERVRVAPVARKMAEKEEVDLSLITPTGPHNTIMKKDVEDYLASRRKQKEAKPAEEPVRKAEAEMFPAALRPAAGQKVELTAMRKTIARRMAKSALSVPHMSLFREVGMDALLKFRESLQADYPDPSQFRISINDFLVRAVALTLKDFPFLNARWEEEEIHLLEEINIGVAVALEEGLIVPAIPRADRLGLEEIAGQRLELVERARQGKLQKVELERGTFTITSLASFGISYFTAIINPPQSAILSVGETQEKLILKDGEVAVQRYAVFGVSIDHRVTDGAYGANFLNALKKRIENPLPTFLFL
jgi:pyruvate dehydrogenase E2 component (dihydrolipoamide acetyltransferase)